MWHQLSLSAPYFTLVTAPPCIRNHAIHHLSYTVKSWNPAQWQTVNNGKYKNVNIWKNYTFPCTVLTVLSSLCIQLNSISITSVSCQILNNNFKRKVVTTLRPIKTPIFALLPIRQQSAHTAGAMTVARYNSLQSDLLDFNIWQMQQDYFSSKHPNWVWDHWIYCPMIKVGHSPWLQSIKNMKLLWSRMICILLHALVALYLSKE